MEDQTEPTSAVGEELPQPQESKLEEGAVKEPAEGAEAEKVGDVAVPKPRTYSEEEWNKRQSSIDKAHATEIAELNQKYEEATTRERERLNQEYLAKVEADGGDVEVARRTIAREEAVLKQEREIARETQILQAYHAQVDEALKAVAANKLAGQYGVDATELLKAQNPLEMENIALKLQAEKLKTGTKKPIKTDSNISSARGVDFSKLSPNEKIMRGLEGMEI